MNDRALEVLDEILNGSDDPDDALRGTVALLAAELGVSWAGIAFAEEDALLLGPVAGAPDETRRRRTPIVYQGARVGELLVDGEIDDALLAQVADRISAHVLLGWDTGGEPWTP